MKKHIKKMMYVCLCFCFGMFFACSGVYAFDSSYGSGKSSKENNFVNKNSTSVVALCGNIEKKEETTIRENSLPSEFESCNYKYLSVRKTISYMISPTNEVLAKAIVDANFRYNPVSRQAVCLSNIRRSVIYNSNYVLDVFSRCTNKNLEMGCSLSKVSFTQGTNLGKQLIDSRKYEINCDFSGSVTFCDLGN